VPEDSSLTRTLEVCSRIRLGLSGEVGASGLLSVELLIDAGLHCHFEDFVLGSHGALGYVSKDLCGASLGVGEVFRDEDVVGLFVARSDLADGNTS